MGDTSEAEIARALDQLETGLQAARGALEPLLSCASTDALAEAAQEDRKAAPYVLSAYALSSLLFAYLRSEGADVARVLPLLAQVKESIESLAPAPAAGSKERAEPERPPQVAARAAPKAAGKHKYFEDAAAEPVSAKKSKKKKQ